MHETLAALDADLVIDTEPVAPANTASEICRACPRLRDGATGSA